MSLARLSALRSLVAARGVFFFLAVASLSACTKNTYLEVTFTGGYTNISSVVLSVAYPKADASFAYTNTFTKDGKGTGTLTLPATLVVQMNGFSDGATVSLGATARDATNAVVATASSTTQLHQDDVTHVTMSFGGDMGDGGVADTGAGGAGGRDGGATGADGCTLTEVKAGETASFVEPPGVALAAGPAADVLWAGANAGALYSSWIRFPKRGALAAPTGTKLSSVALALRVLEPKGTAFNVTVSYAPSDTWSPSAPPSAADFTALMPASEAYTAAPTAGGEAVYQISPTLKTWTDIIATGPISLVVRNAVGATPAASGSLVSYQGGTSGSAASPAPVLRFRFCPP
jgi:hypothetical protein